MIIKNVQGIVYETDTNPKGEELIKALAEAYDVLPKTVVIHYYLGGRGGKVAGNGEWQGEFLYDVHWFKYGTDHREEGPAKIKIESAETDKWLKYGNDWRTEKPATINKNFARYLKGLI